MAWLEDTDWREWTEDPLVERLRDRLLGLRRAALKDLRSRARSGTIETIRAAEQRVKDLEEFLSYVMISTADLEADA